MNLILLISVTAMVIAQVVKVPIYYFKTGTVEWSMMFSTGSMPSSHSAFVVSLVTSIGILKGTASTEFAMSFVFASIVIHDAIKVRGESGKQAVVLNKLRDDFVELIQIIGVPNKDNENEVRLKELIGHKTSEVVAGIGLGIIVPVIILYIMQK